MPPEQRLLGSLLQVFHGIRSERLVLEELDLNLLIRLYLGTSPVDPIWHWILVNSSLLVSREASLLATNHPRPGHLLRGSYPVIELDDPGLR